MPILGSGYGSGTLKLGKVNTVIDKLCDFEEKKLADFFKMSDRLDPVTDPDPRH